MKEAQAAGIVTDPRASQIERLKAQVAELKERLAERDADLAELMAFKSLAISRLAAQHAEIERLRHQAASDEDIRRLPTRGSSVTTHRPCS
ncbi:hypothetical protein [Actinacidiphila glaucinigra]|uniref:Uncharacterized protein n=1 Tax=Actinacidiphila glaucinigra TaxID=235986 RepID=A0A239LTD8_9ACTN|nr:hypothetical protein [Actinacidiphila glaucinigra]SNT33937.1 hypothetical protein SAMN05216252_12183 [Actinacidiphila glaucinigra]